MEWRMVPGFPHYEVSECGRVRRVSKGIRGGQIGYEMKPYRRADGYNMYILRRDNASVHKKAHQLVAMAFIGQKPFEAAEVAHNDGSRDNDHYSNLRWCSRAENHGDKVGHGTTNRGEGHPAHKLSSPQVFAIREMYKTEKFSCKELAGIYKVSESQIQRVLLGHRWGHLPIPLAGLRSKGRKGDENKHRKLSLKDVEAIRQSTLPRRELANRYKVCYGTIGRIKRGEAWRVT